MEKDKTSISTKTNGELRFQKVNVSNSNTVAYDRESNSYDFILFCLFWEFCESQSQFNGTSNYKFNGFHLIS